MGKWDGKMGQLQAKTQKKVISFFPFNNLKGK